MAFDNMSEALAALHSDDWSVRREAAISLGEFGDRRATAALIDLLNERERAEDTAVMSAAIDALALIGDPDAIPVLRMIASWKDPLTLHEEEVRSAAERAADYISGSGPEREVRN